MTAKEMAALLNDRKYGSEITPEEERQAFASDLVVVFGASDDNMEFRGAIYDEIECFEGITVYISPCGKVFNSASDVDDCYKCYNTGESWPITAIWCGESGASWSYQTDIPHEPFVIYEGSEVYCIGIVFSTRDLA